MCSASTFVFYIRVRFDFSITLFCFLCLIKFQVLSDIQSFPILLLNPKICLLTSMNAPLSRGIDFFFKCECIDTAAYNIICGGIMNDAHICFRNNKICTVFAIYTNERFLWWQNSKRQISVSIIIAVPTLNVTMNAQTRSDTRFSMGVQLIVITKWVYCANHYFLVYTVYLPLRLAPLGELILTTVTVP